MGILYPPSRYRIVTDDFTCTYFTILMAIVMIYTVFLKGEAEGTLLVYWVGNSFRSCILCPLNATRVLPQVIKMTTVTHFQTAPRAFSLAENYVLKEIVFIIFYMN